MTLVSIGEEKETQVMVAVITTKQIDMAAIIIQEAVNITQDKEQRGAEVALLLKGKIQLKTLEEGLDQRIETTLTGKDYYLADYEI